MAIDELYRRSADELEARLESVPADLWGSETKCCPGWTVRDLVNHIVNENLWVAPLLGGKTISDVGSSLDGDLLGDDPLAAYRRAVAEVLDALREPGALERTVPLSSGPTPGAEYVAEVLSDQIIHTWDLASTTGSEERLPEELVEFAAQTLEPRVAAWRSAGALGESVEVDEGADRQTKLLALLGRRA